MPASSLNIEPTIENSRTGCHYYIQMVRMDEFCCPEKENPRQIPYSMKNMRTVNECDRWWI